MRSIRFSAASIVALLFAVNSAQAFTYDSRTNQSGAGANLAGSNAANGDKETKIGNSRLSLKFSGGNSQGLGGGVNSRFLPSGNSAFVPPSYQSLAPIDMALGNRH